MRATDPAHEAKREAFDEAVDALAHDQQKNGALAVMNLTQAAELAHVSRGRLYRAIEGGRLEVMPGGGPGKPTMITREALRRAGFPVRAEDLGAERSIERSMAQTPADAERLMERLADQVAERLAERFTEDLRAMLAPVVEDLVRQSMERLGAQIERSMERLTVDRASRRPKRSANVPPREPILTRLRAMHAEGLSTRQMAERLQAEEMPTVSGRGAWTSGSLSRLLQEAERSERSARKENRYEPRSAR